MGKSKKPSMDEKAANEGDKLKHALLLEVLGRCEDWKNLTYAETHAGAGIYLASAQSPNKPHIANLFRLWSDADAEPAESDAGGRYFALLRRWWASERRINRYPGSILQSALYLKSRGVATEFRVTEADGDTCDRLTKAVKHCGIRPDFARFQEKIDWLTKNDPLVLLVDPLKFKEDYGTAREDEKPSSSRPAR
ncbi:MAG TPA: hypothetical protein VND64_03395 [Pirellulales bacterium]|nr:hypothetical protein [Pirellulales bacterium]